MTKCPMCAEAIPTGAERCPQCGEALARAGAPAQVGKRLSPAAIVAFVVLGVLVAGGMFVGIVAAIAIPNLVQARKKGNEAAAIGALHVLHSAQILFREGDTDQDGKLQFGGLAELGATNVIDPVLATGRKQGYVFQCAASSTAPERRWQATASPAKPGTTGDRHFMVDQDGVVYESTTPFALAPDATGPPPGALPVGGIQGGAARGR